MNYFVNVGISYEHPDGFQYHQPGKIADLTGWPADDLARMEADGTITPILNEPATQDSPEHFFGDQESEA